MKYGISLSLALFATWLVWSGHYTSLLITFGALSVLLVVTIARRMELVDEESVPLHVTLRIIPYLPWLVWEIAKANVEVTRQVLDPRLPIRPMIIRVPADQRSELGQVIYANSITLTPGTVSIDLRPGEITVHALSREAAQGVESQKMNRRVCRVEGR